MIIEGSLKGGVLVTPEIKVAKRKPEVYPSEWKFGIGEMLYLSFKPAVRKGEWKIVAGGGTLDLHANSPGEARYFCPATRQHVKLECWAQTQAIRETLATLEFDVIMPTYRFVRYHDFHCQSPEPNAGFLAAFVMTPDTVSFARVALRECGGANVWTKATDDAATPLDGILTKDDHATLRPIAGKKHTEDNSEGWAWYIDMPRIASPAASYSAYVSQTALCKDPPGTSWVGKDLIRTIGTVSGTVNFRDKVFNPIMTGDAARPWLATNDPHADEDYAEYYLDIPVHYAVVGGNNTLPVGDGTRLAVNRHSFKVLRDGTLTVSKGPDKSPESVTFAIDNSPQGEVGTSDLATD
jgi:hypothetical protein